MKKLLSFLLLALLFIAFSPVVNAAPKHHRIIRHHKHYHLHHHHGHHRVTVTR